MHYFLKMKKNKEKRCREYRRKYQREYRPNNCSICGKPIHLQSKLCKDCCRIRQTGRKVSTYLDIQGDVIRDYQKGKNGYKIAKKFNLEPYDVYYILSRNKIKIRSAFVVHSKFKIDSSYFDKIDTEGKAYWLGFFAADGHITQRGQIVIALALRDRLHLEKFLEMLNSNYTLKIIKGEFPSVKLAIGNRVLSERLIELGIQKPKNCSLTFNSIPDKLKMHFVRGIFDGDGWVSRNGYQFSICSNDKTFLNLLRSHLPNIDGLLIKHFRGNAYYLLSYRKAITKKFLDYIYNDATIYLDRKCKIYRRVWGRSKRMFYSVVEEFSYNKDYNDFCMGRIEIFDSHNKSGYAIDEARFIIPAELFDEFREWIDFKESDYPIMIKFNMDVNKFVEKMSVKNRTNESNGQ